MVLLGSLSSLKAQGQIYLPLTTMFCTLKHKAPDRTQLVPFHRKTDLGEPSLPLVSDIGSAGLGLCGAEARRPGSLAVLIESPLILTGSGNLQTLCKRQVRNKSRGWGHENRHQGNPKIGHTSGGHNRSGSGVVFFPAWRSASA